LGILVQEIEIAMKSLSVVSNPTSRTRLKSLTLYIFHSDIMAMAWRKAKELCDSTQGYPDFVREVEMSKMKIEQGEFVVNHRHVFATADFYGMFTTMSDKLGQVDKATYNKILDFAKKRKLDVTPAPHELNLDRNGTLVARIESYEFTSSDPQLFEDIGREVYGLKV
jgi:hypothetical protein